MTNQENICQCGEPHISKMVIHTPERCYLAPQKEKEPSLKSPESIEGWEERFDKFAEIEANQTGCHEGCGGLIDYKTKDFIRQLLHDTEQSVREDERGKIVMNSQGFIETAVIPAEMLNTIRAQAKAEAIAECVAILEKIKDEYGPKDVIMEALVAIKALSTPHNET